MGVGSGKGAKTRAKEKARKAKRARKDAQQLKYQSFRDQGQNQKSKRFTLNSKRRKNNSATKHQHLISNCGNPGCKQCFPIEVPIWQNSYVNKLNDCNRAH